MTSFSLIHLFKDPLSKYGHILRSGLGLQRIDLGRDTIQPMAPPHGAPGGLSGIRNVYPFLIMGKSLVILVLVFTESRYYYCRRDGTLPVYGMSLRPRGLLSSHEQPIHNVIVNLCIN